LLRKPRLTQGCSAERMDGPWNEICASEKNHEVRITCDSIANWTGNLPNTVTASAKWAVPLVLQQAANSTEHCKNSVFMLPRDSTLQTQSKINSPYILKFKPTTQNFNQMRKKAVISDLHITRQFYAWAPTDTDKSLR
jgi:hypothetical protein